MIEHLKKTILSASPFIQYVPPYLETKEGNECKLRKYFPPTIFWSPQFDSITDKSVEMEENISPVLIPSYGEYEPVLVNGNMMSISPKIKLKPEHPFVRETLSCAIGSEKVQNLVADFRRKGSRLEFTTKPLCNFHYGRDKRCSTDRSSWNTLETDEVKQIDEIGKKLDCLDPFEHQKISVQFCSYSRISSNAPYYCVNPW